jgi:hypothetical protein
MSPHVHSVQPLVEMVVFSPVMDQILSCELRMRVSLLFRQSVGVLMLLLLI